MKREASILDSSREKSIIENERSKGEPPPLRSSLRRLEDISLRLAAMGFTGSALRRASDLAGSRVRSKRADSLPTSWPDVDRLLGGGLPAGKLVEIVGRRSTGRFALVLAALAAGTSRGETAALVDLGDGFDPRGAEASGVDCSLLLWIRPRRIREALRGAEMALTAGIPLVVLDLGLPPVRGARPPDSAWIRLARAASARDAYFLVSAPYHVCHTAADIVLSVRATRPLWRGTGSSPRLLAGLTASLVVEKRRGGNTEGRGSVVLVAREAVGVEGGMEREREEKWEESREASRRMKVVSRGS